MFLDVTKTFGVPMMTRRKLGRMSRMLIMKLLEAISESTNRPYVITQWKKELVLAKVTLGAKDDEDHTKSKLVTLETLVELVLEKTKLLCTLGNWKQDVGCKVELTLTIVVELISKGTHEQTTCCTYNCAQEETSHTYVSFFFMKNSLSVGVG
jgi:hypothetical protein